MRMNILAALGMTVMMAGNGFAADIANGEKKAKLCIACHSVTDAKNKVGPSLVGVFGRAIATAPDFKYSQPMLDYGAANGAWDDAKLDAYLAEPKKIVPGGKMAFGGIKKPEDRADLIAYLATLKP